MVVNMLGFFNMMNSFDKHYFGMILHRSLVRNGHELHVALLGRLIVTFL